MQDILKIQFDEFHCFISQANNKILQVFCDHLKKIMILFQDHWAKLSKLNKVVQSNDNFFKILIIEAIGYF